MRVDGGPARQVPARGNASLDLPSFDEHAIQVTRADGRTIGRAFTFSPTNGFFQPPHQHLFCVRIEHSQVESLDPAACWSRVHREHLEG